MEKTVNRKDREEILKLIAISVCVLELLIAACTLFYQEDIVRIIQIPLTNEMANVYINHPEKLNPNERLVLNPISNLRNEKSYLLLRDEVEIVPFPWKAWVLISLGVPFGIAFLVLLFTRAYLQTIEPDEKPSVEPSGKIISAFNRLSQMNVLWFMLCGVIVIFLVWYVPEIIKYALKVAMTWLNIHWWVPALVFFIGVSILLFWIYLRYRLRVRAMDMEMELAKFKILQLQEKSQALVKDQITGQARLLEKIQPEPDKTGTEKNSIA